MEFKTILEIAEREAFILRVWRSLEGNAALQGQILHVGSGKTLPLREPERILLAIQKQAEAVEEKPIPPGIK